MKSFLKHNVANGNALAVKPASATADIISYPRRKKSGIPSNLTPFLPHDLIGGGLPHIPGFEERDVWNAATQACGTEKVHFAYTADRDRLWYIACPSASLSSAPDSWCPLASALPGNSEYWDRESVYLYEQGNLAAALRWAPDTDRLQIFTGAARTILPRKQSMDANIITLNAELADVAPWQNPALTREKQAQKRAKTILYAGFAANAAVLVALVLSYILGN